MSANRHHDPAKRQHLFAALKTMGAACALTMPAWPVQAATETSLPVVDSLADALARALARREPLLVMVSLHGCAFCKTARENYLMPMQAEGVPIVQVDMRHSRVITDFNGKSMTHDQWVRQREVRIAPTVLFFGRDGQEVATRLKGAYLPDFYNAYLEDQLTQARRAVQKQ